MQVTKAVPETKKLRREAGAWLKELRAKAGLSQIELAEKLTTLVPIDVGRIFFVGGGSEAIESALKVARQYHRLRAVAHDRLSVVMLALGAGRTSSHPAGNG